MELTIQRIGYTLAWIVIYLLVIVLSPLVAPLVFMAIIPIAVVKNFPSRKEKPAQPPKRRAAFVPEARNIFGPN
jgi:hypothetical protein